MDPTDDNFDFYAFYQQQEQQQQQQQEQYNHERDIQMVQFGNNANGVGLVNVFTPDTYYCSQCLDPSGNQPVWHVYSSRCNGCRNSVANSADATQRRIQNTVRVSQSEYLENLAGLNVYTPAVAKYGFVNWNQGSDRAEPGRVQRNVPSHGANSTKTSVTRLRPGSCSAPGQGVDIKHGSYARYLARIKGRGPYRTEALPVAPVEGNKTKKYGIAQSHRDNHCTCPLYA
jgi:hypothetical protein